MTDADLLRRAATLMRERVDSARAGRWDAGQGANARGFEVVARWKSMDHVVATCDSALAQGNYANALHIASWDGVAARAVADWLDSTANDVQHVHSPIYNRTSTTVASAVAAARAYLREDQP